MAATQKSAGNSAVDGLTQREIQLLAYAWECMEITPKIQMDKLAKLAKYTPGSASVSFGRVRRKLRALFEAETGKVGLSEDGSGDGSADGADAEADAGAGADVAASAGAGSAAAPVKKRAARPKKDGAGAGRRGKKGGADKEQRAEAALAAPSKKRGNDLDDHYPAPDDGTEGRQSTPNRDEDAPAPPVSPSKKARPGSIRGALGEEKD